MPKFIFDLDGTITAEETLPLIARHFGVEEEIDRLTRETINGNIPFIESFIRRVHILGKLPVSEVDNLLANVPLYGRLLDFIKTNKDNCIIATGNLGCWVDQLVKKIGCASYYSEALIADNKIVKLTNIMNKENIVKKYKNLGEKIIFVGDGNNDSEAMRLADVSIAAGLTHYPANSVVTVSDYLFFTEEALCRQLSQLC